MTTAVTQWEQLSEIQKHNFLEQKEIDCVDQLLTSWNLTQGGVCMHCLFDKLEKKRLHDDSKQIRCVSVSVMCVCAMQEGADGFSKNFDRKSIHC